MSALAADPAAARGASGAVRGGGRARRWRGCTQRIARVNGTAARPTGGAGDITGAGGRDEGSSWGAPSAGTETVLLAPPQKSTRRARTDLMREFSARPTGHITAHQGNVLRLVEE